MKETLYRTACPACGKEAVTRPGDRVKLEFTCKRCTTRFSETIKPMSRESLEKEFMESDPGQHGPSWVRVPDVEPSGPNIVPIRGNRPRSRPQPKPTPEIIHKDK